MSNLYTDLCQLLWEGDLGVSRVTGLANFILQVSGCTFKSYGFSGFEMCHRLRVWSFFLLAFRTCHRSFQFLQVFEVIQSMQLTTIGQNENAGKFEDYL